MESPSLLGTTPLPHLPPRSRRGSIAIYCAIAAMVLIAVMGLALDTGYTMSARVQLQTAADAAALAGAAELETPGQTDYNLVRQAAVTVAGRNTVLGCCPGGVVLDPNPLNLPTGDIVVGKWKYDGATDTYSFDPLDPSPDAVQVRARCGASSQNPPLQLFFGPIFGQSTSEGGRPAIARLASGDDPFLLILNPDAPGALGLNGGADLDVGAGTIQIDSKDPCGLTINGSSGTITAQRTKIVGEECSGGGLKGAVDEGASYLADPLAPVPEPTTLGLPSLPAITSAGTYTPGYYPGGINLNGGMARLLPGMYVIGNQSPGRGVNLGGSGFVDGDGVTIFLRDGASLTTSGANAGLRLTPPTAGTYAGITLFQSRSNSNDASIHGNGTFDVQGILYLPSGNLDMAGNSGRRIGRVIVDTLSISGDARYTFTGVGPRALGTKHVFLAE